MKNSKSVSNIERNFRIHISAQRISSGFFIDNSYRLLYLYSTHDDAL